MNFLFRLFLLLMMSASSIAPVYAAVSNTDIAGSCDIIAADDDKKTDGGKKKEGEAEPECD